MFYPNKFFTSLFKKWRIFVWTFEHFFLILQCFPSPSSHFVFLTFPFLLSRHTLDTLLTGQWCVCCLRCIRFASLSLPEDGGVVLAGAQPWAGRCLVVTGTEGLGNSRASSGQPQPPAVTGSQLTTAPRAGTQGRSPGNWNVWFCLGRNFSQGRWRDWSTAGIWKQYEIKSRLRNSYYYLNPVFIQRSW